MSLHVPACFPLCFPLLAFPPYRVSAFSRFHPSRVPNFSRFRPLAFPPYHVVGSRCRFQLETSAAL